MPENCEETEGALKLSPVTGEACHLLFKMCLRADEVAQQVKVPGTSPRDPHSEKRTIYHTYPKTSTYEVWY